MQNIKDPAEKIQTTKHLRTTPSALAILPCTPFITVVFKEEMLEREGTGSCTAHGCRQYHTVFRMEGY